MEGDLSSSPCWNYGQGNYYICELLGIRYVNETVLETSDQLSQTAVSPNDPN